MKTSLQPGRSRKEPVQSLGDREFRLFYAKVCITQARVFRLRGCTDFAITLQRWAMVSRCQARPALPVQGVLL